MAKYPGQKLSKFFHVGTVVFSGVKAAFQKVGIGNSMLLRCNQVLLKSVGLGGVMTVTNPNVIHLKDLDRGRIWVLKQVVDLNVIAEVGPLVVEGDGIDVEEGAATHVCLRNAEITEEKTSVGRRNMVHEPVECGEYLE